MVKWYGGDYERHLELDYGELGNVNTEQYWGNYPGYELFPVTMLFLPIPLSNPI